MIVGFILGVFAGATAMFFLLVVLDIQQEQRLDRLLAEATEQERRAAQSPATSGAGVDFGGPALPA